MAKAKRIVVKVGTSTLTYENGKLNLKNSEALCRVLSDLHNAGFEVVLVSSGAIGVGIGKLGLQSRPEEIAKRQALAAVGQCELMFMYDKLFGEYDCMVAQVLLNAIDIADETSLKNVQNTFRELLNMKIIPIVNENDTVGVDELDGLQIGDNDTLSAVVAVLLEADLLVILSDIDGLYDANPRENPQAKLIPRVEKITPEIKALAGAAGTNRGTGGMATKVKAAQIANDAGIDCCVMNGARPQELYRLLEGEAVGTLFDAT